MHEFVHFERNCGRQGCSRHRGGSRPILRTSAQPFMLWPQSPVCWQPHCSHVLMEHYIFALARQLSWLEGHPVYQKVVGLIPGQGAYRRQSIDVSLSVSLSSMKTYPKVRIKKSTMLYILSVFYNTSL